MWIADSEQDQCRGKNGDRDPRRQAHNQLRGRLLHGGEHISGRRASLSGEVRAEIAKTRNSKAKSLKIVVSNLSAETNLSLARQGH